MNIYTDIDPVFGKFMVAEGTDANDVFTATSEWAWLPWSGGYYYGEMGWKIDGGAGNDQLVAGDEDDGVNGGADNDSIWGLDGEDVLQGDDGDDYIDGGAMDDAVLGGAGSDWLAGGEGNDEMFGDFRLVHMTDMEGDDTLDGGSGADTMYGGDGNDTYYVDNTGDVVVEDTHIEAGVEVAWSNGYDSVVVSLANYTLPKLVERGVVHSSWSGAVKLVGNAGDNDLMGGVAADTLEGGAGDDSLDGGAGNDVMKGGAGDDIYVVMQTGDQAVELANEGADTVQEYFSSYTIPANVENASMHYAGASSLTGNALNNTVVGSLHANNISGMDGHDNIDGYLGDDVISGGNGNDTLEGSFGSDQLYGDAGNDSLGGGSGIDILRGGDGNDIARGGTDNDTVYGDSGSDQLFGDAGNDLLLGGAGKDWLTGGAGGDTFKFNASSESAVGAWDVIVDFVRGSDRIDLSTIDANSLMAGNQSFAFNSAKPFFTSAGDLWTSPIAGGVSVYVDVNGDGMQDMRIDVLGVTALTAADFVL